MEISQKSIIQLFHFLIFILKIFEKTHAPLYLLQCDLQLTRYGKDLSAHLQGMNKNSAMCVCMCVCVCCA